MRQPVTYHLSSEVGSNAAPEVQGDAATPSLFEAFKPFLENLKRLTKAMALEMSNCIEAIANYATRALPPAAWPLPFRYPLPRRRGRPLGTETVISFEEIGDAYHTCLLEFETRPKRPQVAQKLLVSDSTLYRRLRDEGLSFRRWVQSARLDLPTIY